MQTAAVAPPPPLRLFRRLRRTWLYGTIGLSLGSFALAIALAPPSGREPGQALISLLFLGSSVHVAATAWFYTLPEVRRQASVHRARYIHVPLALIAGCAALALVVPYRSVQWALLAYFGWQFYHFQKQNLGMAALAAISSGDRLSRRERQALLLAGAGGITGLLAHPHLLQLPDGGPQRVLFPLAAAVFLAGAALGSACLLRRKTRPAAFVTVYLISLLFFAPVFLFSSPYAAVAGLTIAHGYQYLLIVALVAGAPRRTQSPPIALALLTGIALLGGSLLSYASHLHGSPSPAERALYGAYLGAVMAHFVIDAALWRLRDEFPRHFLGGALPYLLTPTPHPTNQHTQEAAHTSKATHTRATRTG